MGVTDLGRVFQAAVDDLAPVVAEKQAVVKIGEMLPGPTELVARGPDGERTCELRIGFYRVTTSPTAAR